MLWRFFSEHPQPKRELSVLRTLALSARRLNRPEQASRYFEEAISLADSLQNNLVKVALFRELADFRKEQGQIDLAIQLAQEALRLNKEAKLQLEEVRIAIVLGSALLEAGRVDKAIEAFPDFLGFT